MGEEPEPQRTHIGLLSATGLVAASMVGAGVFSTSGFTLAAYGDPLWVLLAWVMGGGLAICGAISYGALARRFRESGGEYLFLSKAVHPVVGFMGGCVSLLAGFTGALAIAAKTLETYTLPEPNRNGLLAVGVIVVAAVLHSIRLRFGTGVQTTIVIGKFLLLTIFIGIACVVTGMQGPATDAFRITGHPTLEEFALGLMYISFSYSGFNAAVYVSGEVSKPEVNVPRALLFGTILVTGLYLLLNTIFLVIPDRANVLGEPAIALPAARAIGGVGLERFIRGIVIVSLVSSVSALVMSGPRVYAKMADDGVFPAWFRARGEVPVASIWLQAGLAIVVVQVSRLEQLLGYLGFTLSVSAALTVGAIFWVRFREGAESLPVPWYPLPPVVFFTGTILLAGISFSQQPAQSIWGFLTIVSGGIMYWLIPKRHPLRKQIADEIASDGDSGSDVSDAG